MAAMNDWPRRFTMRGILAAVAWLALCFGSLATLYRRPLEPGDDWIELLLLVTFIVSPFAAIGALYGRIWQGLLIGVIFVLALGLVILPFEMTHR
jgi:hypothetical protein